MLTVGEREDQHKAFPQHSQLKLPTITSPGKAFVGETKNINDIERAITTLPDQRLTHKINITVWLIHLPYYYRIIKLSMRYIASYLKNPDLN